MRSLETVRALLRLCTDSWLFLPLPRLWCVAAQKSSQTFMSRWLTVESRLRETDKREPNHPTFKHRDSSWLGSQLVWDEQRVKSVGAGSASFVPHCTNGKNEESGSMAGCGSTWQAKPWRQVSEQEQLTEAVEALDILVQQGCYVDDSAFYTILKRCIVQKDLVLGSRVHGLVVKSGYGTNAFLANHIICMYASHGRLEEATRVFAEVDAPNHHVWASIILSHARHGRPREALNLYQQMRESAVKPNNHIFAAALKAAASAEDLSSGKKVHSDILETGSKPDVVVYNCLVDMYAKCRSLEDASKVFWSLPVKDVVTWNCMIRGYAQHGLSQEALNLYVRMQQEGLIPANHVTFVCLLQGCSGAGALAVGREIHLQIQERGLESHGAVGNSLVNMYAKCGILEDARRVFDNLPARDVVTWNVMIAGYAQHGLAQEAIELYERMQREGKTSADAFTFVSLLQACCTLAGLEKGKEIHVEVSRLGLEASNLSVANALVAMYASCGSLQDARRVFDNSPIKDVITWTAMIAGYSRHGLGQEALELYASMQQENVNPADAITFVCLLQACGSLGVLDKGKEIHTKILSDGSISGELFVANALIDMYSKCGSLDDARRVFDNLPTKDVVTWTAIMAAYAQHGLGQEALHLYASLQQEGTIAANHVTFTCLIQACAAAGALHEGKQLHTEIEKSGIGIDVFIGTSLVDMYSKCGSLEDARKVFEILHSKDVATWNAMIAGYTQHGFAQEALTIYETMQLEGITPADAGTFVCLFQACSVVGGLEKGKAIHNEVKKIGLDIIDSYVGNALIDMYSKCGSLQDACSVFDNLQTRDLVTWSTMIAGYAQHEHGQEALDLHSSMEHEDLVADAITFVFLLQACASVGALDQGRRFHFQIVENGLEHNEVVGNSLVNMYAKCGSLVDARRLFDSLPSKTVVTWNAMITGYIQHGHSLEALTLFGCMKREGSAAADAVTFVCLLQACGSVAGVEKGREIHSEILISGLKATDLIVATALIDMYGKCGSIPEAQRVFDLLPTRDIVTWNAMIAAYARQGENELVFNSLETMRYEGIQPNGITFLSAISVCNHVGLVEKGQRYFESMSSDHSINPTVEHYNCMVDLFARAGQLGKAMEVVKAMTFQPPAEVWTSLLGACQKWSSVELGREVFDHAVRLDKHDAAAYILMSNIYDAASMWEEAKLIQVTRVKAGAWKKPGQTWWIDTNGVLHTFLVRNRDHPKSQHIYANLANISFRIVDDGHVPHLESLQ